MATNYYIGTDGDASVGANWSLGHVPAATEDVVIPSSAGNISDGLDLSANQIRSFTRELGHTGSIGNGPQEPLILDVGGSGSFVDIGGVGSLFLDLEASAVPVTVRESGSDHGGFGLILAATALTSYLQIGGSVKLVGVNVDAVEVRNGTLVADRNCTLTDGTHVVSVFGGIVTIESAMDTIRVSGGDVTINGSGAIAAIRCDGGLVTSNTTGTVTLAQADASGTIDFTKNNVARSVTTIKSTGLGKIVLNPNLVTVTNWQSESSISFGGL